MKITIPEKIFHLAKKISKKIYGKIQQKLVRIWVFRLPPNVEIE